ncbi:DUF4167 domain-containing protein [Pseudotabrizicola sp. L79]|uniref:DUF4167 domain-containing protein n=1 Tax=Pseudotabrizicola sp. L79 TaxID=3118402 RepID=UPI002F927E71
MRSSKSRSRSKQNRPRSLGNIINRVFDSSGPEGKVRGTPQQIIEKYQVLARDAQLSNDRVAAENFLQHAEHYTRMLAEAQREMAAEQEARQQNYQQSGNGGSGNQNAPSSDNRDRDYRDNRGQRDNRDGRDNRWRDDRNTDPGAGDQPDLPPVIDTTDDVSSTLVETPEARSPDAQAEGGRREDRPRRDDRNTDRNAGRRDRRDRGPRPERSGDDGRTEAPAEPVVDAVSPGPEHAAERPKAKPRAEAVAPGPEGQGEQNAEAKPRRARSPKKPKADAAPSDDSTPEAAE